MSEGNESNGNDISSKTKRKNIPKALKNKVWDEYIGREKGVAKCFVCESDMDSKNFECGHVLAVKKGGNESLENLRPVCGSCNKSMGTENLEEFKQKYFEKKDQEKNNNVPFLEKIFAKNSQLEKTNKEIENLKKIVEELSFKISIK